MKLVVTGCAGFIGARVAEALSESGHGVVGLDNLNDTYDRRLKTWRLDRLRGLKGFRFEHADLRDARGLQRILAREAPDAVLNLAARAGVRQSFAEPREYFEDNLMGVLNLLEACRLHGVRRFVQASTSSVYGPPNSRPFREDAEFARPLSPYAASKQAGETLVKLYAERCDLEATILRYFTVYGPAGRPDMSVFRFVRWISEGEPVILYGDGSQERDLTHVDDVARGTLLALEKPACGVVNLGSDRPVSILDVLRGIERLVGREALVERRPPKTVEVHATWADVAKARSLLQWEPRIPLDKGLQDAVEWYHEHREWARDLRLGPL